MSSFEKSVIFPPAWDRRGEGFGVHSMSIMFILKGPNGGVTFSINTGWYLKHVREEGKMVSEGHGVAIEYHSKTPQYAGHTPIQNCMVTGGDCYCGGSACCAKDLFEKFLGEGEKIVWETLEGWYNKRLANNQTYSI